MDEPTRMSPSVDRITFPGDEGQIGVHPTGSGGTARVLWLPVPGPKAQTHCHIVVWTDDDVLTTSNVARVNAGPESEKLLNQL
jgi:hypothetical protein